jgi:hypothetical protein
VELIDALTVYGPLGVGVFALGWAYIEERKAHRQTLNDRLEDMRLHAAERLEDSRRHDEQQAKTMETLRQAIAIFEARNG